MKAVRTLCLLLLSEVLNLQSVLFFVLRRFPYLVLRALTPSHDFYQFSVPWPTVIYCVIPSLMLSLLKWNHVSGAWSMESMEDIAPKLK